MNALALKDSARNVTACVETIGVARAKELLARVANNRPINLNTVKKYSNELKNGRWKLNGETFIIGTGGEFLEGQHRAHAVVETGIPLTTIVVYGIDPEAFDTINTGRSRKPADVIGIAGCNITGISRAAEIVAGALRLSHVIERRLVATGGGLGYSNAATLAAYSEIGTGIEASVRRTKDVDLLHKSAAAALHYVFAKIDPAAADKFIDDLISGAMGNAQDPVLLYRNVLVRAKTSKRTKEHKLPTIEKLAMGVRAWNARRNNVTLKQLKGIITVDGVKTFPSTES